MEYVIRGEKETEEFGRTLAEKLEAGDVLALIGDLGTGKTTLKGLGIGEMITSPTFTIVSEYFSGRLPLFHFDVYRLSGEDEAFEAGLEEYFDRGGICVIEWADIIEGLLPENTKYIFLEYGKAEEERVYKCSF